MKSTYPKFLGLALIALQAVNAQSNYVAPVLPSIPDKVFNIKNFGAISDNQTDNTQAIQKTIDAAENGGGGKVEIPEGTYLCGPLQFYSNLDLHIDSNAVLRFLPINRYPGGLDEGTAFITGKGLENIAITGKGTIDGQGSPWWPYAKMKGNYHRPRMIAFNHCNKVLIEDVTLMNSPMFHIAISGSENVTVSGVTVRAPSSTDPINPSHNTDACDVSGHHILVKNCNISTGDDDYTCGGGTSDVLITNCHYGNGHGVSIGSYTHGGVSNITVENCTFTNTDCGVRIKSDRDRGGVVENMTYRNLTMTNVGIPILIYASYLAKEKQYRDLQRITPEIAEDYPAAPIAEKTPIYRNFIFQNITATAAPGKRAGLIWGLPEAPVTNVLFQNVNIKADKPFGIFFAKNIQFKNCNIITNDGKNKLETTHADITE
ncbi:MAG TPA: glycosyl hydrolase family 28 protein [Hanamia sp.]|nr:glycosyl hydrolase family 28 protein [Hanamia sp.]